MNELKIDVVIDGESYSQRQLAHFQYLRALHVMHEMKYLGAELCDGDKVLSHEDINWMEPSRLEEISLAFRSHLGEEGILALFSDVLENTQSRFKEYVANYAPGNVHTGQMDLTVSGVSMEEFMVVMGKDSHTELSIMPEHYIVVGDIRTGQRGMEAFGLFGEPAYVHGTAVPDVPDVFPFKRDESFPQAIFGEMRFVRGNDPLHLGALHQFKPTADGFAMRSIFFCPKAIPKQWQKGTPFISPLKSPMPSKQHMPTAKLPMSGGRLSALSG